MRMFKKPLRKGGKSKRNSLLSMRKRVCRLCSEKAKTIDYKDVRKLESYIKDRGKMVSSRVTGACAKHQRRITAAIKRARFIALLPYSRV
jgi:small subunit ribosomal protein S18